MTTPAEQDPLVDPMTDGMTVHPLVEVLGLMKGNLTPGVIPPTETTPAPNNPRSVKS